MKRAWIALLVVGCMRPAERPITAVGLRAAVLGLDVATLPANRRAALERGEVVTGAPEHDLYLARGQPILWWHTAGDGGPCKVFVEASLHDASVADLAVTTCGGAIAQLAPIQPALPCWRLAEVAPRLVADAAYFDSLSLERQWQLVAGILRRGQASRDLAIALGAPHNRGLEEREDGVRADEQVFLDASGDAYGLRVTLVDDRVVGWKVPSERRLTPEAEQRRLQAIEQRLTARLTEMEQRSIQQHAETVGLFNRVMQHQDAMLATLSAQPRSAPLGSEPPQREPQVREGPPPSSQPPPRTRPPSGISVTVDRKQLPWGRSCREGSDECAPGSCQRLTENGGPTCTRSCSVRGESCAPGYRCGFEVTFAHGRPTERGFLLCRPAN